MTEPTEPQMVVVGDPTDLVRALRKRRDEMAIPSEVLDERAGLARDHTSKMLSIPPRKGMGLDSFFCLAGALGYELALIETERRMRIVRSAPKRTSAWRPAHSWRNAKALAIVSEHWRAAGKSGGTRCAAARSADQKRAIGRRGAKRRWRGHEPWKTAGISRRTWYRRGNRKRRAPQ